MAANFGKGMEGKGMVSWGRGLSEFFANSATMLRVLGVDGLKPILRGGDVGVGRSFRPSLGVEFGV
jgi:hypothetical protein